MLKTLLKLQFAQFFSSLGNRHSKKGADKPRSRGGMILLGVLLAYCAVVFMGMLGMASMPTRSFFLVISTYSVP